MTALPSRQVSRQVGTLVAGMVAVHAAAHLLLVHGGLPVETALAVIFADLTLTTAALAWWTLVRPGIARPSTLVPVVAAGLLAARALLPVEVPDSVDGLVGGLLVLAEVGVAGVALARMGRVRARWRELRAEGRAPQAAVVGALETVLPAPIARAAATEAALVRFAVLGPFRRAPIACGHTTFSVLHRSQWPGLLGVLAFVGLAEAVCVHWMLADWPVLAAAHGGLVVYGMLWLWGDLHALRLQQIRLTPTHLELQVGLRWSATIARAWIREARCVPDVPDTDALDLSLPGSPLVQLTLDRAITVMGPYGIERTARVLVLPVDQAPELVRRLEP